MSQWEKLIADILAENKNLRFEDIRKALVKIGYTMEQPRSGSSHLYIPQTRLYANHDSKATTYEPCIYCVGSRCCSAIFRGG